MKLGIILSAIFVFVFLSFYFIMSHQPADDGTRLTDDANLVKMTLPDNLSPVFVSEHPDAVANPLYQTVIQFYRDNRRAFGAGDNPPDNLSDELAKLLTDAMNAGRVSAPMFDSQFEMKPQGEAEFGDALEQVASITMTYASKLAEQKDEARALRIYMANWALGQRCFQYNTRLYPRQFGLSLMMEAGGLMSPLVEKRPELTLSLPAWAAALKAIDAVWTPKDRNILAKLIPPVGDLLRVAEADQDISFRVEAVLMLGMAKFNPGTTGNLNAIKALIEKYKTDSDPMIAQAAAAADALTAREVQRMGGSRRNN
ncbi:MAG: hypothetical protein K8S99_11165 [Planctomycetes bacterium]|nr:hypothetical protein [Planctomycetota bacterium]